MYPAVCGDADRSREIGDSRRSSDRSRVWHTGQDYGLQ